jgi:hypothetical protein
MRKYNFEEYRKELKGRYYSNFKRLEPGRSPGRRQRKKEDLDLLLGMMLVKKKKWLAEGKLVDLGVRKYKLVF